MEVKRTVTINRPLKYKLPILHIGAGKAAAKGYQNPPHTVCDIRPAVFLRFS